MRALPPALSYWPAHPSYQPHAFPFSSPWSNKYDPPIEDGDGFVPSDTLRPLEMQFNDVFDAYRNLYFEGGVSSVYLWDLPEGFAGCFLIKKGAFAPAASAARVVLL